MFKIQINNNSVSQHQFTKEVSKLSARKLLKEKAGLNIVEAISPFGESISQPMDAWWKTRIDWKEALKNSAKYKKDYERTLPEKLNPEAQNQMWKKAKQLKDEILVGMLSHEELHPVKQFSDNGTIKAVVDEERLRANNSVQREQSWLSKNQEKIREFKNLMRHLDSDNPNAGDIERYRPRLRGIR